MFNSRTSSLLRTFRYDIGSLTVSLTNVTLILMNNYDFSMLSPDEFEELAKDILSAEHGVIYESFASGRDGGIDLRYSRPKGQTTTIVQCKRYTDASRLVNNLIQHERQKVDCLKEKPTRYIVVCSVNLSPSKVDLIFDKFSPYIVNKSDIITPRQLNSLLAKHSNIEKRHYKLWLLSTNVLERILHSNIENYSHLTELEIKETLKQYAPLPIMDEALDKLRQYGYIIIAGQPGVGKTTLANVMSFLLLGDKENGFEELISIPRDFNDALTLLSADPNKKQLFLFDDFLGENFLQSGLNRHESTVFSNFLRHIERSKKNKALIMTTREYILRQAAETSRTLRDRTTQEREYIVDLTKYPLETKARILYEHVSRWDVPEEHLQYFLSNHIYRKIVKHRNYSPRLIEGIKRYNLWHDTSPEEFCDKLIEVFDNPESLYKGIVDNELSQNERVLLLVMMSFGESVPLRDLQGAVLAYSPEMDEVSFEKSIDILDGTFLLTNQASNSTIVGFYNPTIYDFLLRYFEKKVESQKRLIENAIYLNQLVKSFAFNKPAIDARELFGTKANMFLNPFTKKILVNNNIKKSISNVIISRRNQLKFIDKDMRVKDYSEDLFEHAERFTNNELTSPVIEKVVLQDIIKALQKGSLIISSATNALYIYEYYLADRLNTGQTKYLAEEIAQVCSNYDDLSRIQELTLNPSTRDFAEFIIEGVQKASSVEEMLDNEIQQRFETEDNYDDIIPELHDVAEVFSVPVSALESYLDTLMEPSEYTAGFFSKDDDTFESSRELEGSENEIMDNIFDSLR